MMGYLKKESELGQNIQVKNRQKKFLQIPEAILGFTIYVLFWFSSHKVTHIWTLLAHILFFWCPSRVDEFKYISRLKLHSIHFCFWLQIKAFDKPFNPRDRRRTWDDGQPFFLNLTWTLEFKQKLKITCLIT